jgi:hypothetical protein
MNAATGIVRRLALMMACIGLLALSTAQRAEATVPGGDPSSNGTNQVLACQAMGGTATVESYRTVAGALVVSVTCSGGMGGGWTCDNVGDFTDCHPTGAPLPTWGEVDPGNEQWEVVDDGGLGSPVGTDPVADSPTAPDAGPHVKAPGNDQDQDKDTGNKGKKHKKHKKGGKGRRK